MLQVIGAAAAGFCISLLAVLALRPIAIAVDLIDRPGGRKKHVGEVPIVGGLAMFLGLVVGIGLLPAEAVPDPSYLGACALLVVIGLLDDRFDLSPWVRLPAQIAAATIVLVGSKLTVTSLGDPLALGELQLSGLAAVVFTVAIIVAAINAFNMLDGMDGLAGTTAIVALVALACLTWGGSVPVATGTSFVVSGVVVAFLLFNWPMRLNRTVRCFMGEAGSTLLGFTLACLCIRVSQRPTAAAPPVAMLWLVALPLFELVWSTVRRIVRGVSPMQADSEHFHHLLLKAGFSIRGAFAVFIVLSSLAASLGVAFSRVGFPDALSFLMLVLAGAGFIWLMYRAELLLKLVPDWLKRLPFLQEIAGMASARPVDFGRAGRRPL